MAFEAKVIADSICNGQRLTTMQITFPRFILAEWNTHAMFSRCTSSSRAIPFAKMVKNIVDNPVIPIYWGVNQSGMQAFTELTGWRRDGAIKKWLEARDNAVRIASEMAANKCNKCHGSGLMIYSAAEHPLTKDSVPDYPCPFCDGDGMGLNVHKQIVNRLLEPWMWTTNCTTGDAGAWSNFFALRSHPDAEPHMQKIAYLAQKEYFESTPKELITGQWHTPYIRDNEFSEIINWLSDKVGEWAPSLSLLNNTLIQISTGRCARTSYLSQEGIRDFSEDIKLHDRLRYHVPLHASPFEHVCQAMGDNNRYAKYVGWKSYRHTIPNEYVTNFVPNYEEYFAKQV